MFLMFFICKSMFLTSVIFGHHNDSHGQIGLELGYKLIFKNR